MTRETKIGLLVGLGFIVTFAVLLSHTTPAPPAGDGLKVVEFRQENRGLAHPSIGEPLAPNAVAVVPSATSPRAALPTVEPAGVVSSQRDGMGTQHQGIETQAGTVKDAVRAVARVNDRLDSPSGLGSANNASLPRVGALESRFSRTDPMVSLESARPQPAPSTARPPVAVVKVPRSRIAPPLSQPVPKPVKGQRLRVPSASPAPSPMVELAEAKLAQPVKKAIVAKEPPAKRSAPQEYLVRPGDTVGEIAFAHYGTSKPCVVDFLAKYNKKHIENKDKVIAGQKLMIPQLPPELFEQVSGFDVSKIQEGMRSVTLQELADSQQKERQANKSLRRAPQPSQPPATSNENGAQADKTSTFRWYEVKPNDTLTSIARKELGSVAFWKEIQKLNPNVEPKKLRPGDRVRLPKKPVAGPFKVRDASA